MFLRNLSELPSCLKKNQCLLGLDYGSKVIGVAVSDPALRIASPIGSLVRKKLALDAAALLTIIHDRDIGAMVVGLPKNMDGSEGASAQAARAFIRNITEHWKKEGRTRPDPHMPVVFWDERLSTAAIERFMILDDMSRKRRDEVVDKAVAAYILQGALDSLAH
jgi:putative Holliday junction resolvase